MRGVNLAEFRRRLGLIETPLASHRAESEVMVVGYVPVEIEESPARTRSRSVPAERSLYYVEAERPLLNFGRVRGYVRVDPWTTRRSVTSASGWVYVGWLGDHRGGPANVVRREVDPRWIRYHCSPVAEDEVPAEWLLALNRDPVTRKPRGNRARR